VLQIITACLIVAIPKLMVVTERSTLAKFFLETNERLLVKITAEIQ